MGVIVVGPFRSSKPIPPPPIPDLCCLDEIETIRDLVQQHGADRVREWLRLVERHTSPLRVS